jgi:hypothetical protein
MNYKTIPPSEPLEQFQIDNCRQWIDALRSGNYHQTDKVLVSNNMKSFCCLGVACDIKGMRKIKSDTYVVGFEYIGKLNDTLPPDDFFSFVYGFPASIIIAIGKSEGNLELASLNDEFGFTFSAIADVIEAITTSRVPIEFEYDRNTQINTKL